jgi:hypothetical protein
VKIVDIKGVKIVDIKGVKIVDIKGVNRIRTDKQLPKNKRIKNKQ